MRKHLDRAIADAIALGREIAHPALAYPEAVQRSMATAYCAYYRSLLEFFHDGRQALVKNKKAKVPSKRDILVRHVLPPGVQLGIEPSTRERARFRAADRLGAHLSKDRTRYHRSKENWGSPRDRRSLWRRAERLLALVPNGAGAFPHTAAELARGG